MTRLRERILNAEDLGSEVMTQSDLPEWLEEGESVLVQSITEAVRRKLIADCSVEDGELDLAKFTPALLIETLADPITKKPIFSAADRDAVAAKSSVVVDRVAAVAMRVCGFNRAVTEKNSASGTGDSETASASRKISTRASRKSLR